jgi:hypothetical protein
MFPFTLAQPTRTRRCSIYLLTRALCRNAMGTWENALLLQSAQSFNGALNVSPSSVVTRAWLDAVERGVTGIAGFR